MSSISEYAPNETNPTNNKSGRYTITQGCAHRRSLECLRIIASGLLRVRSGAFSKEGVHLRPSGSKDEYPLLRPIFYNPDEQISILTIEIVFRKN